MLHLPSKAIFHLLAKSATVKRLASRYGMAEPDSFARRFIAGEGVDEALEAGRLLQARGLLLTLDSLGESVSTSEDALAATREYLQLLHAITESGVERNISLKLTQLGLDVDRATCVDNIRRILVPAAEQGFFVRIDMEDSRHTAVTLDVFESLWQYEHRNIGIVLQSYLHRTDDDLRRVMALGARVRLVKGAYREPAAVALQGRSDVNAAYLRQMKALLDNGHYPAIATHDEAMIEAATAYASMRGIGQDQFEFQMLYGIRRDLQARLVERGYRVRIYLPFGRQWFPYFMRRLGERPANVASVLANLFHERRARD